MIGPEQLEEGECYFLMLFFITSKDIPLIESYIYVGNNLSANVASSQVEWYFQDPKSYLKHGKFQNFSKKIKHTTFVADEDALSQMYDLDGLIQSLSKIKPGR